MSVSKKRRLECQCKKKGLLFSQLFPFYSIVLTACEIDAAKGETIEYKLSKAVIENCFCGTSQPQLHCICDTYVVPPAVEGLRLIFHNDSN